VERVHPTYLMRRLGGIEERFEEQIEGELLGFSFLPSNVKRRVYIPMWVETAAGK